MKLTLAFSPCPNDCFMFDAVVNRRINLEGLEFDVRLADVEALNKAAFAGEVDVTKLSYHAYAYSAREYVLLDAGSALGRNCGPLLISKRSIPKEEVAAGALRIAIPGKYTTANFLLFAPVYVLTRGGPQGSTDFLMYEAYRSGFMSLDVGRATSITAILLVALLLVVGIELLLLRREA